MQQQAVPEGPCIYNTTHDKAWWAQGQVQKLSTCTTLQAAEHNDHLPGWLFLFTLKEGNKEEEEEQVAGRGERGVAGGRQAEAGEQEQEED